MSVLALSALLLWSASFSTGGTGQNYYQLAKREVKLAIASSRVADGSFSFVRDRHRFYHSPRPWMTFEQKYRGRFEFSEHGAVMFVADSLIGREQKAFASYQMFDPESFGQINYGDTVVQHLGTDDREDYLYQSPMYSPSLILHDFLHSAPSTFIRLRQGGLDSITYAAPGDRQVTIVIDPRISNVLAIDIVYPDDLRGDVRRSTQYLDYQGVGRSRYPTHVVEHTLGILTNEVRSWRQNIRADSSLLLDKIPEEYELGEVVPPTAETATTWKYNEHVGFVELKQAETRVMVVNFSDHLLIAEAPLSSENGELILKMAHELYPGKPVQYFAFGHHHPTYLGGMRAMVHEGAIVLALPMDSAYIRQLVTFRHQIHPDILEKDPRPLKMQMLDSVNNLGDSSFTMQIYHIPSKHTDDYLIYYFPQEKFIFEDDVAGLDPAKPLRAATEYEKGLNEGIEKYGLDVLTVVQAWPVKKPAGMIFPYSLLESSVKMMK